MSKRSFSFSRVELELALKNQENMYRVLIPLYFTFCYSWHSLAFGLL